MFYVMVTVCVYVYICTTRVWIDDSIGKIWHVRFFVAIGVAISWFFSETWRKQHVISKHLYLGISVASDLLPE